MRISKKLQNDYEILLKKDGADKVYRHALGTAIINLTRYDHPENMLLDQAEGFFSLFRQTGNDAYFIIGKCLRKAAHKIYREQHRKHNPYPLNKRFLNLLKCR